MCSLRSRSVSAKPIGESKTQGAHVAYPLCFEITGQFSNFSSDVDFATQISEVMPCGMVMQLAMLAVMRCVPSRPAGHITVRSKHHARSAYLVPEWNTSLKKALAEASAFFWDYRSIFQLFKRCRFATQISDVMPCGMVMQLAMLAVKRCVPSRPAGHITVRSTTSRTQCISRSRREHIVEKSTCRSKCFFLGLQGNFPTL